MKKISVFLTVLAMASFLGGCSARYGNEQQYQEGDWYGLAGSSEVAKIQQDKLALEKLKALPIYGDEVNGYKGIVVNRSGRHSYTFKLFGPENKSYFLNPKGRTKDSLIPGRYRFQIKRGGRIVGYGHFSVGPQIQKYNNKNYHWFVYADR